MSLKNTTYGTKKFYSLDLQLGNINSQKLGYQQKNKAILVNVPYLDGWQFLCKSMVVYVIATSIRAGTNRCLRSKTRSEEEK